MFLQSGRQLFHDDRPLFITKAAPIDNLIHMSTATKAKLALLIQPTGFYTRRLDRHKSPFLK